MKMQRLVESRGGLPREPDDGEAVRAVRGDLEFDGGIVEAERRADVVAGLAILLDNQNTVLDRIGKSWTVTPSSETEHIMPSRGMPRSLPFLIFLSFASVELSSATGTRAPSKTFVAAVTI
jgi:hypothetical protein